PDLRHTGSHQNDEGASGTANLMTRAAKRTDQKAADDGGDQPFVGADSAGDSDGHGQRQCHDGHGQTRLKVRSRKGKIKNCRAVSHVAPPSYCARSIRGTYRLVNAGAGSDSATTTPCARPPLIFFMKISRGGPGSSAPRPSWARNGLYCGRSIRG